MADFAAVRETLDHMLAERFPWIMESEYAEQNLPELLDALAGFVIATQQEARQ